MNPTIKKITKPTRTITFQPNDVAKTVLSEWDKTGYDRTILLNQLLVKFGQQAAKELPPLLQKVGIVPKEKMVRGGGFEPPTPTVSR